MTTSVYRTLDKGLYVAISRQGCISGGTRRNDVPIRKFQGERRSYKTLEKWFKGHIYGAAGTDNFEKLWYFSEKSANKRENEDFIA